ncbi:MAG: hypothetical protein O7B35_17325 [Deltaproteobacteria bacterium]|nr:hypothetical protein [Deltaproteobacteria bacterium]
MGKKKSHEGEVQTGLEQLRRLRINVDDRSPALVGILNSHIERGREIDLAIVFLLGRIADPATLEVLTAIEKKAGDKEIKKEVRRSLFKLAQKGISSPQSGDAGLTTPKSTPKFGPEIEGYLSSVGGGGGRLVWLTKPQMGRGIHLLQGMVSDREGLMRVGGALIRRKELRRMEQDIKENYGVTMISVPWEYADQILYEGFEKARGLGRNGVEQFSTLRALFSSAKPKKDLSHPIYDRLSLEGIRSGAWRDLSRRLLDEAEFLPWVLDEDWVQPYLEQLQSAKESRLVLNELQKEERFSKIVRDAVQGLFSGEKGHLFQRRMEDMALYLVETRREEEAKLALAVALQLKEGGPGELDLSFLTGLIQKSLSFYTAQDKAKPEEPSLIIEP